MNVVLRTAYCVAFTQNAEGGGKRTEKRCPDTVAYDLLQHLQKEHPADLKKQPVAVLLLDARGSEDILGACKGYVSRNIGIPEFKFSMNWPDMANPTQLLCVHEEATATWYHVENAEDTTYATYVVKLGARAFKARVKSPSPPEYSPGPSTSSAATRKKKARLQHDSPSPSPSTSCANPNGPASPASRKKKARLQQAPLSPLARAADPAFPAPPFAPAGTHLIPSALALGFDPTIPANVPAAAVTHAWIARHMLLDEKFYEEILYHTKGVNNFVHGVMEQAFM